MSYFDLFLGDAEGQVLYTYHEKSAGKEWEKGAFLLCMITLSVAVLNCIPAVSIVYTNGVVGVDSCFVQEFTVTVHAHTTQVDVLWCAISKCLVSELTEYAL